MPAEETHEIGRRGVLGAQQLLWRLLGERIHLPFNAYNHRSKLTFNDELRESPEKFVFDLGGFLERQDPSLFGGRESTDVFVEVKSWLNSATLLQEYATFLRHAALVSLDERHRDTWFIFLARVPFGSSKGADLCNGVYLKRCRDDWPEPLKGVTSDIHMRICLIVATESLERLLNKWTFDGRYP